jgi:integrase
MLGGDAQQQGRRERVSDYLDTYVAGRVAVLKPSSRAAFRCYARHLRRELSGCWLDEVTVGSTQLLIARLSQAGLSRATISAMVSFLRRVLRSARVEGIAAVAIGPRELALPRETRPRQSPRCFSVRDTQCILAAAEWPWRALFALQAYLGLRAGESLGLAWSDIDVSAKVVRVRQQASHGRLATLKSLNSVAALPLPDPLAAILNAYREVWKPNDRELLFANRRGEVLWAGGVRRNHLAPLLKRLGIAPAGFHAWRHALATEAFRAGVGAAAVRQLLRHGNINVTMRYSRVSFDDLVSGSNAVANLIRAVSEETQQRETLNCGGTAFAEAAGSGALINESEGTPDASAQGTER